MAEQERTQGDTPDQGKPAGEGNPDTAKAAGKRHSWGSKGAAPTSAPEARRQDPDSAPTGEAGSHRRSPVSSSGTSGGRFGGPARGRDGGRDAQRGSEAGRGSESRSSEGRGAGRGEYRGDNRGDGRGTPAGDGGAARSGGRYADRPGLRPEQGSGARGAAGRGAAGPRSDDPRGTDSRGAQLRGSASRGGSSAGSASDRPRSAGAAGGRGGGAADRPSWAKRPDQGQDRRPSGPRDDRRGEGRSGARSDDRREGRRDDRAGGPRGSDDRRSFGGNDGGRSGPPAEPRPHNARDLRSANRPDRERSPEIDEDVKGDELDRVTRAQIRNLEERSALWVSRHLVMAGRLLEDDPELAFQHALAASRRGGRLAAVREAVGLTAYAAGHYGEALREFRTFRRISGSNAHLPVMADCERGLGRPDRALDLARSEEAESLDAAGKAELAMVLSGARTDLGQLDAAVAALEIPQLDLHRAFSFSPRLFRAYAEALDAVGRTGESAKWRNQAKVAESALGLEDSSEPDIIDLLGDDAGGLPPQAVPSVAEVLGRPGGAAAAATEVPVEPAVEPAVEATEEATEESAGEDAPKDISEAEDPAVVPSEDPAGDPAAAPAGEAEPRPASGETVAPAAGEVPPRSAEDSVGG